MTAAAASSALVATVADDDATILCMVGAKVRNWAEGAIFVCCADKSEMLDVGRFVWSLVGRTIVCGLKASLRESGSNYHRPGDQERGTRS